MARGTEGNCSPSEIVPVLEFQSFRSAPPSITPGIFPSEISIYFGTAGADRARRLLKGVACHSQASSNIPGKLARNSNDFRKRPSCTGTMSPSAIRGKLRHRKRNPARTRKGPSLYKTYLPITFRTINTRNARPKPPPNSQTRKAGPAAATMGVDARIRVIDFFDGCKGCKVFCDRGSRSRYAVDVVGRRRLASLP
jgi:hypothetical protein